MRACGGLSRCVCLCPRGLGGTGAHACVFSRRLSRWTRVRVLTASLAMDARVCLGRLLRGAGAEEGGAGGDEEGAG